MCVYVYASTHVHIHTDSGGMLAKQLSAPLPLKKQTEILSCVKPANFCRAKHLHLCWFETANLILLNVESGREERNWYLKFDGCQCQDVHACAYVCVCVLCIGG